MRVDDNSVPKLRKLLDQMQIAPEELRIGMPRSLALYGIWMLVKKDSIGIV